MIELDKNIREREFERASDIICLSYSRSELERARFFRSQFMRRFPGGNDTDALAEMGELLTHLESFRDKEDLERFGGKMPTESSISSLP